MSYLEHLKEAYCLLNHDPSLPLSTLPVLVFDWSLETFRFKDDDEDDYENEIWLKVFLAYSQIKDTPLEKLALLPLVKEVTPSPDRKMIKLPTFDNSFLPLRHSR